MIWRVLWRVRSLSSASKLFTDFTVSYWNAWPYLWSIPKCVYRFMGFIFSLADDMFALGGPYDLCFGYCHWALRMDSVHDWQNDSITFCMFSPA